MYTQRMVHYMKLNLSKLHSSIFSSKLNTSDPFYLDWVKYPKPANQKNQVSCKFSQLSLSEALDPLDLITVTPSRLWYRHEPKTSTNQDIKIHKLNYHT